jgi:hypothetical protein
MSKPFRWIGPGIFTDFVDGKAFAAVEGEVVRDHTIDPEKLDSWVKAGTAEYINLAENMGNKLGGSKKSDESKREAEALQRAKDQTDANTRLAVISEIRELIRSPLFTDADRAEFEKEIPTVPADHIAEVLENAKRELELRQKAAQDLVGSGEGAGPKGDGAKDHTKKDRK